jgi:hypothetical protein
MNDLLKLIEKRCSARIPLDQSRFQAVSAGRGARR